jgi:glycosyltransferase involved in cell wall biosynthesis
MKLTAAIITLNEAENIERCIRSLLPVADEIIVLDAFSTDNTPAICQSLNVRFVQKEWMGYSQSKNYLNSLAEHEYILSIDADEVLSQELAASILKQKETGLKDIYSLNRLTNYLGRWIYHSGWYPDVKIRLFPKAECHWEGEFVHETLACPKDKKVVLLKGHLEHYSYKSFEDHRQRADKYSALTARKMSAAGKKASFLKPYVSAMGRFIAMFFIKKGFLDGKMGFKIALISAQSNIFKYKELRRLNREKYI